MNRPATLIIATALMLTTSAAQAKAPAAAAKSTTSAVANNAKSCTDFTQNFYNWYVVQMNLKSGPTSIDKILAMKPKAFSAELTKALKEDSAASAKVKDEIVGLDFDPVLATQSDANKLLAGTAVAKGNTYLIPMFDHTEGRDATKPAVTAEVTYVNGNWVFTNFHYGKSDIPANENLIGLLKTLRADRDKYDREKKK